MPRHVAIVETKGNQAFGLGKGHKTTPTTAGPKISRRTGKQNKRVKFIRDVVREAAGFAPYEKRCMELLRIGKDKRALKFCKNKVCRLLCSVRLICPPPHRAASRATLLQVHCVRACEWRVATPSPPPSLSVGVCLEGRRAGFAFVRRAPQLARIIACG